MKIDEKDAKEMLALMIERLDPDLKSALLPLMLNMNDPASAKAFAAICDAQAERLKKKDI
jgi:hypothetical protein